MAKDITKSEDFEERETENEQKNQNTEKNEELEKIILENSEKNKNIENNQDFKKETKKGFKILNYSVWRLLAYFIIYSVIGYIVETLFGLIKYGTLESRQSFLYGPFCSIYGLGAVSIIVCLQYFKKNYNTIFIGGAVLGLALEYVVSWIGEVIFNVRWWDYSNIPLNLNGRICLLYGLFWGFLSLYLMISLNPKVDKLIDLVKKKLTSFIARGIVMFFIVFIVVDCILSALAIMAFMVRTIEMNDIDIKNKLEIEYIYEIIYSDENASNFIYKYWGDEKMIKTFPQLKVEDSNGNIIYFKDFFPDIKPYYLKLKET